MKGEVIGSNPISGTCGKEQWTFAGLISQKLWVRVPLPLLGFYQTPFSFPFVYYVDLGKSKNCLIYCPVAQLVVASDC